MSIIRVLIVDDTRAADSGLRQLLAEAGDIHIVGHATTMDEMKFVLRQSDLLLVNADIGYQQARSLISAAHESHPDVKVVVVGIERQPERILKYIEAGAVGYVLQRDSPNRLLSKVRLVNQDKAQVSPQMAARLINRLARLSEQQAQLSPLSAQTAGLDALTPRQLEVLALVSESLTNQEIAERLDIQRGTVKNHVHNILRRLELSSREEAAALYRAHPGGSAAKTNAFD